MKIKVLETFMDGAERYEKDDERTVSDKSGRYFCGNGWAADVSGEVETAPRQETGDVRLDIRGSGHEQRADEV